VSRRINCNYDLARRRFCTRPWIAPFAWRQKPWHPSKHCFPVSSRSWPVRRRSHWRLAPSPARVAGKRLIKCTLRNISSNLPRGTRFADRHTTCLAQTAAGWGGRIEPESNQQGWRWMTNLCLCVCVCVCVCVILDAVECLAEELGGGTIRP